MSDLYADGYLTPSLYAPERIAKWDTSQWEVIHELTGDARVDAILVDEAGVVYVSGRGEFVTAPDPNYFGREIVLGEIPKKRCPYCGNSSGETDSRKMCISCGGDLNG